MEGGAPREARLGGGREGVQERHLLVALRGCQGPGRDLTPPTSIQPQLPGMTTPAPRQDKGPLLSPPAPGGWA